MAKRRCHVDLLVDSEATADSIIIQAQTQLTTYSIYFRDIDVSKFFDSLGNTGWHVVAQIRFNVDADATSLKDWVVAKWNLLISILAGSRVSLHTCPHEQNEKTWFSCIEDFIVVK